MLTVKELQREAFALRREILSIVRHAKAGHIGGDLSVCDILSILYNRHMNVSPASIQDPGRDRFILSKGHCVEALYAVLLRRGFFSREALYTIGSFGTKFIGHPSNKIPGIEMNSGSLGHGLPVAVGIALAGMLDGASYRTYVVMGDGELAEGSIWEGANAAGHYELARLTAIVDRNHLQISGCTEAVMTPENLAVRFTAFGWRAIPADGHDYASLDHALRDGEGGKGEAERHYCGDSQGLRRLLYGKRAEWHHRVPTEEEIRSCVCGAGGGGGGLAMNTITNRQVLCDVLLEHAAEDRDIVVLCSDSRGSASLTAFAKAFPAQFIETGSRSKTLFLSRPAWRLAGKKPFAASPASFLSSRSLSRSRWTSLTRVSMSSSSGSVAGLAMARLG